MTGRVAGDFADRFDSDRLGPLPVPAPEAPLAGPPPEALRRARARGAGWAIRLACVWDTVDRYDTVRRRRDRLPAHHLMSQLARAVGDLAESDVAGSAATWGIVADRLAGADADPLGDATADAVDTLVAHIRRVVADLAADPAA